jgi:4-amino-4-deoxy-L-arabinose transferase-like glycosyltransferase
LVILLAAAALRWHAITRESLFLDEFWFDELSSGRGTAQWDLQPNQLVEHPPRLTSVRGGDVPPAHAVWTHMNGVTHPPLFPLMLRFWREVLGDGDLAARSFAAIFSLVALVLMFDVARLLHGTTAGLWVAALMAVAGPMIELSQQVRGYTLAVALALAVTDALLRIERDGPNWRRLVALGASVVAFMLVHYVNITVCVVLGIYALIRLRGKALWQALGAFAAAALIYLIVWGPFFLRQRVDFAQNISWLADNPDGHALKTLGRAASAPLRLLLEPLKSDRILPRASAILYAVPLVLLFAARRRDMLLWAIWLPITVGTIAAIDLWQTTWQLEGRNVRYFLLAGPAVYAIIAAVGSIDRRRPWLAHLIPAVVVLGCIGSLEGAYNEDNPDWRQTAQALRARLKPGEILLLYKADRAHFASAGSIWLCLAHYLPDPLPPIVLLDRPPDPTLRAALERAPGVWLITRQQPLPSDELLPGFTAREIEPFPHTASCQRFTFDGAPPGTGVSPGP